MGIIRGRNTNASSLFGALCFEELMLMTWNHRQLFLLTSGLLRELFGFRKLYKAKCEWKY